MAIHLDDTITQALDETSVFDIAVKLTVAGRSYKAWSFLLAAKTKSPPRSLLTALRDWQSTSGLPQKAFDSLISPLGPLVGAAAVAELASGADHKLSGFLGAYFHTLDLGQKFRAGYIATLGPDLAAQLFCEAALARGFSGFLPTMVFSRKDIFADIPPLARLYADLCLQERPESPKVPRVGFHAILGYAALGNPRAMQAAIDALAAAGVNVADALGQRWPDGDQRDLPARLRENNALAQAMVSLDPDTMAVILAHAPRLSPLAEATRAGKIIEAMVKTSPSLFQHLRPLAEGALALAEAHELARIKPKARSPSKKRQSSL